MSLLESATTTGAAGIGLYVRGGEVFLVRPSKRNPQNRYALNIGNLRVGEYIEPRFISGMVFNLKDHHRMTPEEAKRYGDESGKCAWCGHGLSDPGSILRGMGPTCFRKLEGWLK